MTCIHPCVLTTQNQPPSVLLLSFHVANGFRKSLDSLNISHVFFPYQFLKKKKSLPKDTFIDFFREKGREDEREGEKH